MALIDKASLLMVPSTYEAGTLYNVLPSGNRAPDSTGENSGYDQTRADFTFDRGSNTAATRVNSDGLIEKYRENTLTESNNFSDSDWAKTSVSVTSGQSGYDGTNNAWKLESTTIYSSLIGQTLTLNGVQTFSVYAKAGTANYLVFYNIASSIPRAWYNLSNGTIESTLNEIDAKIESIGNGWYRCSMTYSQNVSEVNIYLSDANNSFSSAIGSNIYIQNAQLESGLVSTDYLDSTSVTGKAGVLIDLPRINYDANGENGALLLEPSRQQLYPYSEYSGAWTKSNWTTTDNYAISPEGVKNAFRAVSTATNGTLYISATGVTGQKNTLSVWAKSNTGSDQKFRFFANGYTTISNDYTATTEWQRFDFTYDCTFVTAGITGASTELSDVLFYGFQQEAGSYATSYIPNHSGTGGVTRAADSCNSSSLTTSTDFTIFFEAPNFCLINGSTGGSYDNIQFVFSENGGPYVTNGSYHIYNNTLYYYNGSGNTSFGGIYNNQTDSKFVIMKRGDKVLIFANGAKKTEATLPSGGNVSTWDTISLTQSLEDGQGDVFGSNYKQLVKFDEALTDAECVTLTTL